MHAITREVPSSFAVALAAVRILAPVVPGCPRGLRICLFSAEEWALSGSTRYLDEMPEAERRELKLDINLDTVGGDDTLTALTSEFAGLSGFVEAVSRDTGIPIGVHLPMMPNSDHFNFARHGIPALRLLAGFDRPGSRVRHILSAGDTRDKANEAELRNALLAVCAMAWRALNMTDTELGKL